MTDQREHDIVLFGATGFVGRLTAAHLAEHAPGGTRIALAGRSRERLEQVRSSLPPAAAAWPLVVADAEDLTALGELARSTRVVVTTVGPYQRYGKALVRACAESGTHYCDLTGEILFARWSSDTWSDAARRSGARIVHACGFDSIPSDLGVHLLARTVREAGEGELGETTLYVRRLAGGLSGGTIDSMRQQAIETSKDAAARRLVADPYGYSPDRPAEPTRADAARAGTAPEGPLGRVARITRSLPVRRAAEVDRWTAPFIMASFNTRVVRRSNALTGFSYGRGFRYREVMTTGSGPRGALTGGVITAALVGGFAAMSLGPTRTALDRVLPKPGEGPGVEQQEKGAFRIDIRTTSTTGARFRCLVGADKDPGYSGTAVMLGQSALSLAQDAPVPGEGGVLTPATAMGDDLVARLRDHGFTLEASRVDGGFGTDS